MSNARELAEFAAGYGAGSFAVGKNKIINGGMMIDQRNAGAAVTASGSYPVDRFIAFHSIDGALSWQQNSSAPAGFVNSAKFTTTTADTSLGASQYVILQQRIEGYNVADLAWGTASAKTVTLSFWVRSSLTGTFGGSLMNSGYTRSYPFSYTISAADTWEQKTITIAGDTTGTWITDTGIGIRLSFGLGIGSNFSGTAGAWASSELYAPTGATSVIGTLNATWYITGVQLEEGSVATPFENRLYPQELALCMRYYWKSDTDSPGSTIGVAGYNVTGNGSWSSFAHAVPMRTAPTMTKNGTWGVSNCNQPTIASASKTHWVLAIISTSTNPCYSTPNSSDDYITASAEL